MEATFIVELLVHSSALYCICGRGRWRTWYVAPPSRLSRSKGESFAQHWPYSTAGTKAARQACVLRQYRLAHMAGGARPTGCNPASHGAAALDQMHGRSSTSCCSSGSPVCIVSEGDGADAVRPYPILVFVFVCFCVCVFMCLCVCKYRLI